MKQEYKKPEIKEAPIMCKDCRHMYYVTRISGKTERHCDLKHDLVRLSGTCNKAERFENGNGTIND